MPFEQLVLEWAEHNTAAQKFINEPDLKEYFDNLKNKTSNTPGASSKPKV